MLTRQQSRQPSAQPKQRKPSKHAGDVIIISDDEEDKAQHVRRQKRKSAGRATPNTIGFEDVLEISDDDDQHVARRTKAKTLRKVDENMASVGGSSSNVDRVVMDQINVLQLVSPRMIAMSLLKKMQC